MFELSVTLLEQSSSTTDMITYKTFLEPTFSPVLYD